MKFRTTFLVYGIIFFICCKKKDSSIKFNDGNELPKGTITLIFQKAPEKVFIPRTENKSLGGREFFRHIATFSDSDGISHIIDSERTPHTDTIHISIKNPKVEIYFERLGLEGDSYLFNNGDKVLVKYENGNPEVIVLNRQTKPFDYKYRTVMFDGSKNRNLSSFEAFFRSVPFPKSDKRLSKEEFQVFYEDKLQKNSILLLEDLKSRKNYLDSLFKNTLLSEDIYEYYSNKLKFINWSRLAKLKELPYLRTPLKINKDEDYEENYFKDLFKQDSNSINTESIIKAGDSLFEYKFYREFVLNHFMPNYIENRTTKYSYEYENFGDSRYSWNVVFDTILKSDLFPKKVQEYLLFKYMDRISQDMIPENMNSYYKKFKDSVSNKAYADILNSKYKLDKNGTDKLVLRDSLDKRYLLEDIIENNEGKLIFVEFWASWCSPCIESIPQGNKLRADYSEKEIVFVSISVDKSFKDWRFSKALKKRKNSKHEYVLRNPYSSHFMKSNHIRFIPRYILIDKKGSIVNEDAPGPDKNEIRRLFDKYLK